MEELLREMHAWMRAYMKSFYNEDKKIQQAIGMKEVHTKYVTRISCALAGHLELSLHDRQLAEILGLFHDVGRFRQFTIYRTFVDARSEDHADLGVKVLSEQSFFGRLSEADRALVLFAIRNHNKKAIAPAPDEKSLFFARLLRDADKLDIYRVLSPYLRPSDGIGCSQGFPEQFMAGEQCDYTRIRTDDDRKLVRLMWVYDVNFSWTLREIQQRGYIDRIISCLPDDAKMREGIRRLRAYTAKKCQMEDIVDF